MKNDLYSCFELKNLSCGNINNKDFFKKKCYRDAGICFHFHKNDYYLATPNGELLYYNAYNVLHKLNGTCYKTYSDDRFYYINGLKYMYYQNYNNTLYIYKVLIELNLKYENYIKLNLKSLIDDSNPNIKCSDNDFYYYNDVSRYFEFNSELFNKLPNWVKDCFII